MAETKTAPDFEQIAGDIIAEIERAEAGTIVNLSFLADMIRRGWNLRGAADLAAIEASLASQMGVSASGPYVKNIERALKELDR